MINDPATTTVLLLLVAAFAAGWIDAVVGGGGLIQLPALLIAFPSAAPVQLLATNKLASVMGTVTSTVTYLRRVKPDLRTALPLTAAGFAGSLAGAVVASQIPRSAFDPIILVVLIVVGAYAIWQPAVGADTELRFTGRKHYFAVIAIGAALGFYDGAIGPGFGSFMVFALVGLLGYEFLAATAKTKLVNVATNIAALLVFLPQGAIAWGIGLGMGVANIAGAYLGARTAVKLGTEFVRRVFLVVVGALILKLGWSVLT